MILQIADSAVKHVQQACHASEGNVRHRVTTSL